MNDVMKMVGIVTKTYTCAIDVYFLILRRDECRVLVIGCMLYDDTMPRGEENDVTLRSDEEAMIQLREDDDVILRCDEDE